MNSNTTTLFSCNFFFSPVPDTCDLRHNVGEAAVSVASDILHNIWIEPEYQLKIKSEN